MIHIFVRETLAERTSQMKELEEKTTNCGIFYQQAYLHCANGNYYKTCVSTLALSVTC